MLVPYSELDALAAAFEVPNDKSHSIVVQLEGASFEVGVSLDSFRVVGVDVDMAAHPFPEVTLRAESDADRRGKERGINAEIQVGDPEFDRLVYIETDATEGVVRTLLARPEHRAAIRELLWGGSVRLSARGVSAGPFGMVCFEPDWFRKVATQLLILRTLPAVPTEIIDPASRRGASAVVVFCALVPVMLLAMVCTSFGYWPHAAKLPLIGAGVGLGAWFALRFLLAVRIRGHSRAYRRYLAAAIVSFVDLVGFGVAGSVLLNAWADTSATVDLGTRVIAIRPGDGCTHATIAAKDPLESMELCFTDGAHKTHVDDAVIVHFHPGFLGFTWDETAEAWTMEDGGK